MLSRIHLISISWYKSYFVSWPSWREQVGLTGMCLHFLTGFLCFCSGNSVDDLLDAENRRLADNLASKVSRLKSVRDIFCVSFRFNLSMNLKMWKCVLLLSHMFTNCWLVSVLWQLAFEIDRDADDQNDYLDNMVRNDRFRHLLVSHCLLMTWLSSFRTPTSWVRRVCCPAAWSVFPPWCGLGGTTAVFCVTCQWGWSWSSSCFTTWSPGYSSDFRLLFC